MATSIPPTSLINGSGSNQEKPDLILITYESFNNMAKVYYDEKSHDLDLTTMQLFGQRILVPQSIFSTIIEQKAFTPTPNLSVPLSVPVPSSLIEDDDDCVIISCRSPNPNISYGIDEADSPPPTSTIPKFKSIIQKKQNLEKKQKEIKNENVFVFKCLDFDNINAALETLTISSVTSKLIEPENDNNFNCKLMLDKINVELYAPPSSTPKKSFTCHFTSGLTLKFLTQRHISDSQIEDVDIDAYLPTDRNELNFDSIIAPVNISALNTTSLIESSLTRSSLRLTSTAYVSLIEPSLNLSFDLDQEINEDTFSSQESLIGLRPIAKRFRSGTQ